MIRIRRRFLGLALACSVGLNTMAILMLPALWPVGAAADSASQPTDLIGKTALNTGHQAPTVSTALAERQTIGLGLDVSGSLVARREVPLGAEIGGLRAASVTVDLGDRVEAGQLLVRFDTTLLTLQLVREDAATAKAEAAFKQAEASLPEAEAALRVASADFERAETLRVTNVVSVQLLDQRRGTLDQSRGKLDTARAAVSVAQADVLAAKAAAAETKGRIVKSDVFSPVAGLVARRNIEPGAVATPSSTEPLFKIIADSEVELAAEVPDIDLSRVKLGQAVNVTLADNTAVKGRVRLVAPSVDGRSRLGTVYVALTAETPLRPGGYARAKIVTEETEAVTIPMSAIDVRDGAPTVLVVGSDDRARRRQLAIGTSVAGRVQIARGLTAGERVVLSGAAFLRDGDLVKVALAASEAR